MTVPVSRSVPFGTPNVPVFFQVKKKYIYISDNAYENFDSPTVGENMYRSRTVTDRKERERKREMCRLVIIECGLRLRRVRNGYV